MNKGAFHGHFVALFRPKHGQTNQQREKFQDLLSKQGIEVPSIDRMDLWDVRTVRIYYTIQDGDVSKSCVLEIDQDSWEIGKRKTLAVRDERVEDVPRAYRPKDGSGKIRRVDLDTIDRRRPDDADQFRARYGIWNSD